MSKNLYLQKANYKNQYIYINVSCVLYLIIFLLLLNLGHDYTEYHTEYDQLNKTLLQYLYVLHSNKT